MKRLLFERHGRLIGAAERLGKAFTIRGVARTPERALAASTGAEARLWHRRLGHFGPGTVQRVEEVTTGLQSPVIAMKEPCEPCTLAKTIRVVNRESPEQATVPLARIHTDFWGPYSVPSLYGCLYFVSFTNEATRKAWVFCTKDKAFVRPIFIEFKARVELESGFKIQAVRANNAPEFKSLGEFYRPYGIQFEFIEPYFHQQNGVPERLNRTLVTMSRAMLQDAKLPEAFWQNAVETACYLRNRVPVGPKGITPEEAYTGKKPYVGHLRAWGCLAYPFIPLEKRRKLQPIAGKAIFIGYMPTSRQYKLYDPKAKRVIVSTAPIFREGQRLSYDWGNQPLGDIVTVFDPWEAPGEPSTDVSLGDEEPGSLGHAGPEEETPIELGDLESDTEGPPIVPEAAGLEGGEEPESGPKEEDAPEEEDAPRRSGRVRAPPQRFGQQALAASEAEKPRIPQNEFEALKDPQWAAAMQEEITNLMSLGTWEYAKLPKGRRLIGCKWVFAIKYTPTGLIDRYKARLVAQGFKQLPGDDYLETFSPTIRAESLRTLLAIAAQRRYYIRQIDIVSAYPRAKLHALVYMRPPRALKAPEGMVCLLNRPLYGLKQLGREWYLEAYVVLENLGFRPCFSDPSVFVTKDRSLIIGLYMDDMLVIGYNPEAVEAIVQGI